MVNKNRTMLILGVILLIAIMSGQDKKEAVITEKIVSPGQSMNILGELWVKETATSWVPEEATKVHWSICSDFDCFNVVQQGYEPLTNEEYISLNSKLTSPFKGATYEVTIQAPITPGFYWYEGFAATKDNVKVLSILGDVGSSISAQKFEVRGGTIVPCGLESNIESLSISNGVIRVTVQTKYSGNQPNCVEETKTDIAFEVICDSGYRANENGRQSTCGLTCQDTTWSPAPSTVCDGDAFVQTSNCNTPRDNIGTKTTGECAEPTGDVCGSPCTLSTSNVQDNSGANSACTTNWCFDAPAPGTDTCQPKGFTRDNTLTIEQRDSINGGNVCAIDFLLGGDNETGAFCKVNSDCDDSNPCTADVCGSTLTCSNQVKADGTSCGTNQACQAGVCKATISAWSPAASLFDCGETFKQTNSLTQQTRDVIGEYCSTGTCNLETAECEEEEDKEFDFNKYIPYLIIFFALIIGMKLIGKNK